MSVQQKKIHAKQKTNILHGLPTSRARRIITFSKSTWNIIREGSGSQLCLVKQKLSAYMYAYTNLFYYSLQL